MFARGIARGSDGYTYTFSGGRGRAYFGNYINLIYQRGGGKGLLIHNHNYLVTFSNNYINKLLCFRKKRVLA